MPIATPEVYAQMLDTAKQRGFAFPAINVSSTQTLNAALKGFADAGSDGIVQISTGGAEYLSGQAVKDMVTGASALAELAGSYASYYVGRRGGRPLVHKLGRYVLVTESDVSRAERFLEGRGAWAIPVGRMLPFVRAFTSIVAGLVRIPAGRFGVLSLIGTVIYATALSSAGYALGSTWNKVSHGLTIVGYALFALVVIAIVGFVAYRWRQFRREGQLRRESAVAAPGASVGPGPGPGPGVGSGSGPGVGPGSGSGVAAEPRPKPRSHRAGKLDAEVG